MKKWLGPVIDVCRWMTRRVGAYLSALWYVQKTIDFGGRVTVVKVFPDHQGNFPTLTGARYIETEDGARRYEISENERCNLLVSVTNGQETFSLDSVPAYPRNLIYLIAIGIMWVLLFIIITKGFAAFWKSGRFF